MPSVACRELPFDACPSFLGLPQATQPPPLRNSQRFATSGVRTQRRGLRGAAAKGPSQQRAAASNVWPLGNKAHPAVTSLSAKKSRQGKILRFSLSDTITGIAISDRGHTGLKEPGVLLFLLAGIQ